MKICSYLIQLVINYVHAGKFFFFNKAKVNKILIL